MRQNFIETQNYQIIYDNKFINYQLLKYQRKSLEISICPEKKVTVKAPRVMSDHKIDEFIFKKLDWIIKKLHDLHKNPPRRIKRRRYVNGEDHLYLGKNYPLCIIRSDRDHVCIRNKKLVVETTKRTKTHIKELIYSWYLKRANSVFHKMYDECWEEYIRYRDNYRYAKPNLKIKLVKSIWGSLSSNNNMTLNLELIRAPKNCLKYLIMHELCHLKYKDHGRGFCALMSEVMPNWKKHKNLLDERVSYY